MKAWLKRIWECLIWLLTYRIKIALPGIPVWLLLGVVVSATLFFILRPPGGRPFDDGTSDRSPITDIDKPENILASFSTPLDTTARPFASPVVLHLARACDAAYSQGETTVPRLFYDLKFDRVIPMTARSDFAFVGIKDKMAVIVFRGTNEISDWFTNVQLDWEPIEHGRLHSGFWFAYGSLKEQILVQLKAQSLSSVWITGHSLGGAMALCCAYDLKSNTEYNIDGVVTFGQPKLADRNLARYIDSKLKDRYLAIVADEDPVADAVPSCHFCGDAIWFKDDTIRYGKERVAVAFAQPNVTDSIPVEDEPFFLDVTSEEEFKQQQEMLKQTEQPFDDGSGRIVVRSILPFFRDHNMSNYIGKLRRYFSMQE